MKAAALFIKAITKRIELRQPLDHGRHVGDRKHETGQQHGGKVEQNVLIMACCCVLLTVEIDRPMPYHIGQTSSRAGRWTHKFLPSIC